MLKQCRRDLAPLPSGLGHGFTARGARDAGVHANRLRQPDVTRLAHGLYAQTSAIAPRDTDAHRDQLWRTRQIAAARAIATLLPDRHFFAGRTAAALWGLPVSSSGSDELAIATCYPHRATRRTGLSAVQVRSELVKVVRHDGAPLTDPASTWAMLAGRMPLHDAVALGDAVIRRKRIPGTTRLERPPLAVRDELEAMVGAGRRVGVARLREAFPLLSPHSASPPESHLRLLLGEWGLPDPALDHDVHDSDGRLLGCSELAFPEIKLALEYESVDHMTRTRQWNRDLAKYHDYTAAGWEVHRVTATLLYPQRAKLRTQLTEALIRRGLSVPCSSGLDGRLDGVRLSLAR